MRARCKRHLIPRDWQVCRARVDHRRRDGSESCALMYRPWMLFSLVALLPGCGGPRILTAAPGGGGLDPGQSVLVDDGRCPAGQLSRVTGAASLTASRTYSCVAKP